MFVDSVLAENTPTTDMAPDIMADMVNADCVHIRWLDALCPVLVMFAICLVHTVDRFMNEG